MVQQYPYMKTSVKKLWLSGKICGKKFLLIESRKIHCTYNSALPFVKTDLKSGKPFYFYYLFQIFM